MTQFRIRPGTKCKVRKIGEQVTRPYTTTKHLLFTSHGLAANGGLWTFQQDGWELLVAPQFVKQSGNHEQKNQPTRYSTFNKGIMGRNGRGASRRRNMRYQKRKN